jgi:hypothetical protein
MAASAALLEAGFFVQGIRPPTVAANTSRLRIGLSALHSSAHIDALLQALGRLAPEGMDRAAAPSQAISPASPSASPSAEPLR